MGRFLGQSYARQTPDSFAETVDVTTNITLALNSIYYVNTTAAIVTLTLPQLPSAGDFVDIIDAAGTFDIFNCVIIPSGDGSTVAGFADNLTLNLSRLSVRLQYSVGRTSWLVTQLI